MTPDEDADVATFSEKYRSSKWPLQNVWTGSIPSELMKKLCINCITAVISVSLPATYNDQIEQATAVYK